jgi:hypothetical protein
MPPVKELIGDKKISIPVSWLIAGIVFIVSVSVGYGGYKTAFQVQQDQLNTDKQQIETLRGDLNNLAYELGRLKVSVDDLKEAIDRKR